MLVLALILGVMVRREYLGKIALSMIVFVAAMIAVTLQIKHAEWIAENKKSEKYYEQTRPEIEKATENYEKSHRPESEIKAKEQTAPTPLPN